MRNNSGDSEEAIVEVVRGEGTRQKPRQEIKAEEPKPFAQGTTDEDTILREMQEALPNYQELIEAQEPIRQLQQESPLNIQQPEKTAEVTREKLTPVQTQIEKLPALSQTSTKYSLEFILVKNIGAGGLSQVDLVQDRTGTQFAYKYLNEQSIEKMSPYDSDAKLKALRLLRHEAIEINELAKLGSSHTPRFAFDATTSDKPGIIVEYVPNSLEEKIEEGIPAEEAIDIFFQMSDPIKLLHEKQIALMDIKPSNYRARESGEIVLVDLNLKRAKEATHQSESLMVSAVTDSGKTIGTPLYMAPEQEEANIKEGQEHLVDIFQLGSLLYQTLTKIRPAGVHDSLTEFNNVARELGKDKTKKLDDVINKALARNPLKRQQSVDDLVREVKDAVSYKVREELKEISEKNKNQTLEQKVNYTPEVKVSVGDIAREGAGVISTVAKYTAKILDGALTGLLIPTNLRRGFTYFDSSTSSLPLWEEILKGLFGFASIILTPAASILANMPSLKGYSPEVGEPILLTFLATNAVSGAYEIGRHIYRKAKGKKQAELEERIKNHETEVIEKIKRGDLSCFVNDKEFRTPEGQIYAGIGNLQAIFYFRGGQSEDKAIEAMKKHGVAYDDASATRVLELLTDKTFIDRYGYKNKFIRTKDSNGRTGYLLTLLE